MTIDIAQFDLASPDDVMRLGGELGGEFNIVLASIVQALATHELRVIFLTYCFACPVGGMRAALGREVSQALCETLLLLGERAYEQTKRGAH